MSRWNYVVDSAASHLSGRTVDGGWLVGAPIVRRDDDTGGNPVGYLVSRDDGKTKGFLKALNLARAAAARVMDTSSAPSTCSTVAIQT
jgi:hypothetical protein